jgi:pimeloyl-ACP methyl ester carboxylesterase
MSDNIVVFSHGKESGPWGTKITALAEVARGLGWRVESVDYRGLESVEGRLGRLCAECRRLPGAPVLVGSSLGGWLAAAASRAIGPDAAPARGLFLMAPAFDMPGLPPLPAQPAPASMPTVVVHGWQDDIVPVGHGLRYAEAQRALTYLVDDDHRLIASLPEIGVWLGRFLVGLAR